MSYNEKSVIDVNATQKMSSAQLHRVIYGNTAGFVLNDNEEEENKRTFGEFLSDMGENIVRFILILTVFNPLFFWAWALALPKWTAECIDTKFFLRKKLGRAIRRADIWEISHILPMKHRFIAMEVLNPKEFPIRQQVLYFNTKVAKGGEPWEQYHYSPDALRKAWDENIASAREKILEEQIGLEDEQLLNLEKNHYTGTLAKYMNKHTVSNTVMRTLYNSPYRGEFLHLFFSQIAKVGASADIIAMVKKEDEPALKKALSEFSQVAIVRKSADKEEKELFLSLVKSEYLCPRAQRELTLWQYRLLPFRGKKLEEEIILLKANPKNHYWKEWIFAFMRQRCWISQNGKSSC